MSRADDLPPLDEMRSFAAGMHQDVGPMFGRDVVRLIDRYEAALAVVRAAQDEHVLCHPGPNGCPTCEALAAFEEGGR